MRGRSVVSGWGPVWLLLCSSACSGEPVSGSAKLPDCTEAPQTDLSGTWFDEGTLTVTSEGCESSEAPKGTVYQSCPLNWVFSQQDNSVEIEVDGEYRLEGRFCGDTLHLKGGWWLPVQDEQGGCGYEDDSGDEVAIDAPNNSLERKNDPELGELLEGRLSVRSQCSAEYQVRLSRVVSG